MYRAFYGLKEKPFNPTPDPKFLFLTPGHREALAQLVYGVRERSGFIVMTGEVGTGKTTLLRAVVERVGATTACAFVSNPNLGFDGLLEYVLEEFGISKTEDSRSARLLALNRFLLDRHRAGQNTLLIVDEAQNLDADTLEQVRLLSNFETNTDKLLQIVLAGQPELQAKLNMPGLRQLKQRIGSMTTIQGLRPEETPHYIRTRLRIAGAADLAIFSERAVGRIAAYTRGVPRVINLVCDNCLLIGYADQRRRIERDIVDEAIRYLQNGARPRPRPRAAGGGPLTHQWILGSFAAALLAGAAFVIARPEVTVRLAASLGLGALGQIWYSLADWAGR